MTSVASATRAVQLSGVSTSIPRDTWRSLLESDPWALPEQSPDWINAITAEGRFKDASRLYTLTDGRRFVLPLVRRRGLAGAGGWLQSPPEAWGIGGPVGPGLDGPATELIVADLATLAEVRISVRPDPATGSLWPVAHPRLVRMERRAHVLELFGSLETIEAGYSSSTRQNVRRAIRSGVEVRLAHDGKFLAIHHELFMKSVNRWASAQREPASMARFRARRRDPLRKLQSMADHLGEGFCNFVAFHEGVAVASIIVLVGRTAHYTRGAMDSELAGPVRANELLHSRAIQHAAGVGCSRYHMGESGGSTSLSRFKEKFGAVPHDYAELRLERLPVTSLDTALRTAVKRSVGFRDH
jgi:hypothetical protein